MPTDLELIKELEREIGIDLTQEEIIDYSGILRGAYQIDFNAHVIRLALEDLELKDFPRTIMKFKNLVYLSLYDNQVRKFPPEIKQLTNLTELYLAQNQLSTLPPEITKLTNLTKLNLFNNRLSVLPPDIVQLKNLRDLDISGNQGSVLPPEIIQLNNLTKLNLAGNELTKLPSEITQLTNLKTLWLRDNELSTLPPDITQLTKLRVLNLSNNQLSMLPHEITKLTNLTQLNLDNNPLKQLPPEIATADDNIKRIRNYFAELEEQGEDYIYEAKLILVGEPGAGKTSLSNKLQNPKYPLSPTEPMTRGIDVERWRFPYTKEIPFQCNIWDFGGQDIMHATHRYFLTKRSLYVVVADNRKEDTDFYYWLNLLELLSGGSRVLIALNEKYEYKKYVPENILRSFESVQKVYNVNLANNMGLNDLSKAIRQNLCDLEHVGKDPIPKKWVRIREKLEKDKRNYISLSDYLKICKENGIEDEDRAGYISEFLHDLGVILHFHKDRILRNTIILNARWATEAVYQILFDNTIIGNGGKFDNSDLGRVWHQTHYRDNHPQLLQLMLNFKLCYEIGNTQTYIIPELLPEKSSADRDFWTDENLKEKGLLHFEYRYDFMPKGIISRLIVRMNKYIYNKQQWKSGVVLESGDSVAEIVENFNQKVLKIRIAGGDRLDALAVIRKEIKELHDTFENLIPHEMVPCNCVECQGNEVPYFFKYDELKQYRQEGEKYIKCRVGKIKNVDVLSLISDVFIKEEDRMNGKSRDKSYIGTYVHVEGAKAEAIAQADARADVDIDIAIDIKVDLPAIQDDFVALKEAITEANPGLEEELNRIEDSLDEVSADDDKKALKKPMNKMHRFLEKVADENSNFHKAIKGAKKGIELAQKVGKTYNKFAQWLALPQVPDLFL